MLVIFVMHCFTFTRCFKT